MGDAIARGVVTDPLVTSSPATQGVSSGSIVGPPGGGVTPPIIVDAIPISFYVQCDFEPNPESISGSFRLDVRWSEDGTRVITCRSSSDRFDMHDVDPAFGIAPGNWTNRTDTSFNDPRWIWWKPDGKRLFAQQGSGTIFQFDTVTPFDITALVGAGSIFTGTSGKLDAYMSADGFTLWIYTTSSPTNSISEFALSTAFDITTMNLTATQVKTVTPDPALRSIAFSDDGRFLYMIAMLGNPGTLASYALSVPFDISTAGPFTLGPAIGDVSTMSIPRGLNYRPTDGALYVFGDQGVSGQRVKLFCPTPDPDITEYSFTSTGTFTIAGNNHNTPYFNLPGTRVYFNRTTSVETWQYSMSTPGDMSTIAFELTHLWGTTQFQRAISFSPDRTKFYKIRRSSASDDFFLSADPFSVLEAGDVSGGNPYTLTGVSSQAGVGPTPVTPTAFVVAANNLDMFVMSADVGDRAIYHNQMSIAGDAGTATPQGQALDVSSEFDTNLFSIVYSPDGSKLFVVGTDSGATIIAQYDLGTAYDVNTASYSGKQITVTPLSTVILGLFVWANPSGGFQLNLTWPVGGASNGSAWAFDQYDAP